MMHDHPVLRQLIRELQLIAALCCILISSAVVARAEQPFMTIEGDTRSIAWWVLAEFHPFTTEVRGIPAGQIRKGWCKATEFRKDLIPSKFLFEGGGDAMEASKQSFAVEGNFDGSSTRQLALVGVYEDCKGARGRFFMILDLPTVGKPRIRLLDAFQMPHQYTALSLDDDKTITLWACMDCDNFAKLKWDRKRHKFVWLSPPNSD
ncbi:hypothetical protein LQG66_33135 [Bradyrhizobium ontarionense]|uniref:Secreted protein n=1 Tax=Bradyrhizobium ontarionense TaxID=2898149 RepID=A0ABY3RAC4_9BRAD|nr:hypothetical protein [Bradyrhizobium sp. A19]UFZ03987.1 hypothetical protein LQG66_33135 [Bradyrhizobium sp. A19]